MLYTYGSTMSTPRASLQHLRHPEFWVIASVVLILPPAYFWLFGLLHALGVEVTVAENLLSALPETTGVIFVFVLPFAALLTSYICYQIMRNAFSTLLLSLSMVLVIASVCSILFR